MAAVVDDGLAGREDPVREPVAAPRPAAGGLVLLPHAGLVGEPDLHRGGLDPLLACDLLQPGGEDLLKSAVAPPARAWWRGRADSFRQPMARSSRLGVCLATPTRNSSRSHRRRSTRRQRTTPWRAGVGPLPIAAASAARCASLSRDGWPGALRSISPSGPSALNRSTQSRTICSVTPPMFAASARDAPS